MREYDIFPAMKARLNGDGVEVSLPESDKFILADIRFEQPVVRKGDDLRPTGFSISIEYK